MHIQSCVLCSLNSVNPSAVPTLRTQASPVFSPLSRIFTLSRWAISQHNFHFSSLQQKTIIRLIFWTFRASNSRRLKIVQGKILKLDKKIITLLASKQKTVFRQECFNSLTCRVISSLWCLITIFWNLNLTMLALGYQNYQSINAWASYSSKYCHILSILSVFLTCKLSLSQSRPSGERQSTWASLRQLIFELNKSSNETCAVTIFKSLCDHFPFFLFAQNLNGSPDLHRLEIPFNIFKVSKLWTDVFVLSSSKPVTAHTLWVVWVSYFSNRGLKNCHPTENILVFYQHCCGGLACDP